MSSSAALRIQIEHALQSRFPAALSPAPHTIREVAATGIEEADRMLEGGLPVGAISEVTGAVSSGRTSLVLAFVAQRTAEDRVCAWVDANDAFDPESAAANGVNLKQLLWVRCRDLTAQDSAGSSEKAISGNAMCDKAPGKARPAAKPWARLDQAIRATDILLQAGGFASIVLDLGDTAMEYGNRIPLATWFRYRQAADRTRCSLVVLGQSAYGQSSAAVTLDCAPLRPETAGGTVLRGFTFAVRRGRAATTTFAAASRSDRKPPASSWSAASAWDAEKRA